jgi:hypothetical protein
MAVKNPNVRALARSGFAEDGPPNRGQRSRGGGLCHEHVRHTTRFTVIGNHLAQHPELSLVAIGLGAHIQSLPRGARVDIKSLAGRFPEGATRIAGGLRELEKHGYLRRVRERVQGGRIVTRTVSCNRPGAGEGTVRAEAVRTESGAPPGPPPPSSAPRSDRPLTDRPVTDRPLTGRAPRALPAVPRPAFAAPALLRAATDLLTGLRHHDARLLLSARDTAHLVPGVAAWLERDVEPAAVRRALTADLPPEGLRRPAALLAHRLTDRLPAPPPFRAPAPPPEPPPPRLALHNCDGCERAFRAPAPGRCRDCRGGERAGDPA